MGGSGRRMGSEGCRTGLGDVERKIGGIPDRRYGRQIGAEESKRVLGEIGAGDGTDG